MVAVLFGIQLLGLGPLRIIDAVRGSALRVRCALSGSSPERLTALVGVGKAYLAAGVVLVGHLESGHDL